MNRPHSLEGAVTVLTCGGNCGDPVTACLKRRDGCTGSGWVHVRSRLHDCAAGTGFARPAMAVAR